jgi:hypothetical protein
MAPTSVGPVKQVNAGVLDTGYVESGPADGPAGGHPMGGVATCSCPVGMLGR